MKKSFLIPAIVLYVVRAAFSNNVQVGTVLFTTTDVVRRCWSDYDKSLLRARAIMQDVLPDPDCLDFSNPEAVVTLLDYFHTCYKVISISTYGKVQHLLLVALSDAFGGYLKAHVLPYTKWSYYAGLVKYSEAKKLFLLYDDIKSYLRTDGRGWSLPSKAPLRTFRVKPLVIKGGTEEACKVLFIIEKTEKEHYMGRSGKKGFRFPKGRKNQLERNGKYSKRRSKPSRLMRATKSMALRRVQRQLNGYNGTSQSAQNYLRSLDSQTENKNESRDISSFRFFKTNRRPPVRSFKGKGRREGIWLEGPHRGEGHKEELRKGKTYREEALKEEASREEARKEEARKHEDLKEEPLTGEPCGEDLCNAVAHKEGPSTEDGFKEEARKEEAIKEGSQKESPCRKETPEENPHKEESSKEYLLKEDYGKEHPCKIMNQYRFKENSSTENLCEEYVLKGVLCKQFVVQEDPHKEHSSTENPCKEYKLEEDPCKEYSSTPNSSDEHSSTENPCKEYMLEEDPCKEYSSTPNSSDEHSSTENSRKEYSSTANPGKEYSSTANPGKENSSTTNPGKEYSSTTNPGKEYSSTEKPCKEYNLENNPCKFFFEKVICKGESSKEVCKEEAQNEAAKKEGEKANKGEVLKDETRKEESHKKTHYKQKIPEVKEEKSGQVRTVIVPLPVLDDYTSPTCIALPFRHRPLRNLKGRSSAFILESYYTSVIKCFIAKGNTRSDIKDFNGQFHCWLTSRVLPLLADEQWYPGFGGVLRILETIKLFGEDHAYKGGECHDYGFLFDEGAEFSVDSSFGCKGSYKPRDVCDVTEGTDPTRQYVLKFGLIISMVLLFLLCCCCFCWQCPRRRAISPEEQCDTNCREYQQTVLSEQNLKREGQSYDAHNYGTQDQAPYKASSAHKKSRKNRRGDAWSYGDTRGLQQQQEAHFLTEHTRLPTEPRLLHNVHTLWKKPSNLKNRYWTSDETKDYGTEMRTTTCNCTGSCDCTVLTDSSVLTKTKTRKSSTVTFFEGDDEEVNPRRNTSTRSSTQYSTTESGSEDFSSSEYSASSKSLRKHRNSTHYP